MAITSRTFKIIFGLHSLKNFASICVHPINEIHIGHEVLITVTTKSGVFWVVVACSSNTAPYFGGTYCFHHQGQRVSRASLACFLLLLFFCFVFFPPTQKKLEAMYPIKMSGWLENVVRLDQAHMPAYSFQCLLSVCRFHQSVATQLQRGKTFSRPQLHITDTCNLKLNCLSWSENIHTFIYFIILLQYYLLLECIFGSKYLFVYN